MSGQAKGKQRNDVVDMLRGIAMLLVVLGHTMMNGATGAEGTIVFNIIWTLQMPLFILISGYVTKYSRGISDFKSLLKYLLRKTIAYMLPWVIWTFVVRGLIIQQENFLDVKYLLWHMDAGYWFLCTIWMIAVIFGVAQYVGAKLPKGKVLGVTVTYGLGAGLLLLLGKLFGLGFLGIKLTLYYMPFYFAGYLYGQYGDLLAQKKFGKILRRIVLFGALALWLVLVVLFRTYSMTDNGSAILIRAVSSMAGCIAVCGLGPVLSKLSGTVFGRGLKSTGTHSLEIYLIHTLVLEVVKAKDLPEMVSFKGAAIVLITFALTMMISAVAIYILNRTKLSRKILFGKD